MKVVICGEFPEKAEENIFHSFPLSWEVHIVPPSGLASELSNADILIPEHVEINADLLSKASKLKLVQTGAGYDNVDLKACTEFGVQACNAAGVNAYAVAEHVMALILSWYKNIPYLDHFLKDRGEADQLDYTGAELYGKTIGIIGLGHVGRIVAEYCNAFHMTVLGYSHKLIEMCSVEQVDLDTLFRDSDIISLHVPLTDSTRHLINAETFSKMKPDALLINTSRGGTVDEAALITALENKDISGACLDVFETEPLKPDSPLRDLKNVLLTPHTAGLPDGIKYHKKRYAFFVRNIEKVMRHETPECCLNTV